MHEIIINVKESQLFNKETFNLYKLLDSFDFHENVIGDGYKVIKYYQSYEQVPKEVKMYFDTYENTYTWYNEISLELIEKAMTYNVEKYHILNKIQKHIFENLKSIDESIKVKAAFPNSILFSTGDRYETDIFILNENSILRISNSQGELLINLNDSFENILLKLDIFLMSNIKRIFKSGT